MILIILFLRRRNRIWNNRIINRILVSDLKKRNFLFLFESYSNYLTTVTVSNHNKFIVSRSIDFSLKI